MHGIYVPPTHQIKEEFRHNSNPKSINHHLNFDPYYKAHKVTNEQFDFQPRERKRIR